jgi:formate dehydrogenase subunit gamma
MRQISRFSTSEVIAHAVHTLCFVLLILTGAALYMPQLSFLGGIFGGLHGSRMVHRIAAFFFVAAPLIITFIALFMEKGKVQENLRELFSFDKDDLKWMLAFPLYFFGGPDKMPPQPKFKAGERVKGWLDIFGCGVMIVTGALMVWPAYFPAGLVRASIVLHDIFFFVLTATFIFHTYLALVFFKGAWTGMVYGTQSEEYVKHHHAKWYDKLRARISD